MSADWTELTFKVARTDLDTVSSIAEMCVSGGIYIEDYSDIDSYISDFKPDELVSEELLELAKDRENAIVHIYVSPEDDPSEALMFMTERLNAARVKYETGSETVREEDWANNWKQYFRLLPVGSRLWITPTWVDEPVPAGRTALHIDPGSSFGTGQHDTTRLCLAMLEGCVQPGAKVLDIGCGSGILSIGAMLLGAESVKAVDIEQNAAESALENAVRNGIDPAKYETFCGNILEDAALADSFGSGWDVVCANIVSDILIAMRELFVQYLRTGGTLLLSGIIDERLDEVKASMQEVGLQIRQVEQSAGWAAVRLEKA